MITPEKQEQDLLAVVRRLRKDKFYGGITINFGEGNISSIEVRQMMKVGNLSPILVLEDEDVKREEDQETHENLREEKRGS